MLKSKRIGAVVAAFAASALTLTGCASGDGDTVRDGGNDDTVSEGAFPVTIEHAFGETTIEEAPSGVITWGWGAADAAVALDTVPVAMPTQPYGGDEEGVLPWISDRLEELGAETPTMLDSSTGEVPIEQVASLDAEVFLAPYSGITQEEYDQLTEMGLKVIAYPEEAWAMPWREVIAIVGEALGKTEQVDELLTGIDDLIAAEAEAHPEFEGVTIISALESSDTFFVYSDADARAEFSYDLGFVSAPALTDLNTGESPFYSTIATEELDSVESDVLVLYADTQEQMDAFLASDQGQLLPQNEAGTIAQIVGVENVAAVSPPTALSMEWGLDNYIDALTGAVSNL
ncbi:MAG TPA: ABC transporter substrate-binding protein [Candidatus Agrococcus pullicola]|uniref:ABC transporter substrate-binding protein n=1 Tax=Candidatus Agrococcus pullicola TaxID=2838429 RepID=A0A9D2CAK0_9MICO|nr:ABC transporter substrate-binding protein [Candidatus Agrococcus pullicola]